MATTAGHWVGLGAVFWLVAAVALRLAEPLGVVGAGAAPQALALAVVAAALAVTVIAVQALLRLSGARLFEAVSVMTMTALLLDGLAFSFAPGLYGNGEGHRLAASALVLWGGGVGMLVAWWRGR